MSQKDKKASCLSIFIKSWLGSAALCSLLTIAAVASGIHFLDWDRTAWTTISGWTSYPVLAALFVGTVSTALALVAGTLFGAAAMFLSKGGGSKATSSRPTRPQSRRKTTV